MPHACVVWHVGSRRIGFSRSRMASSIFFLQVMQSRDYPQSVNLIAFLLSGFDFLFEMKCHGHGQSETF